ARRRLQRDHLDDRAEPLLALGRSVEEAARRLPDLAGGILRRGFEAASANLLHGDGTGRARRRSGLLSPGRPGSDRQGDADPARTLQAELRHRRADADPRCRRGRRHHPRETGSHGNGTVTWNGPVPGSVPLTVAWSPVKSIELIVPSKDTGLELLCCTTSW